MVPPSLPDLRYRVVMLGRNRLTFEPLAVKEVVFDRKSQHVSFNNELTAMNTIPPHRNIVQFKGSYSDPSRRRASLVFEYVPYPSLSKFLSCNGPLQPREALYVIKQVVDAVEHMVHYGIAHRDIKSENVLIHPNSLHVKICDFGLSCPVTLTTESLTHTGTPIYMSPQVLEAALSPTPYNVVASEIWSIGVLLFELLLGSHPFKDSTDIPSLLHRLRSIDTEVFQTPLSPSLKSLLVRFLKYDEGDRIDLQSAANLLHCMMPTNPRRPPPLKPSKTSSLEKSKKLRSANIFFASHGCNRNPDGTTPKSQSGMTKEISIVSFRTILSKSTPARLEQASRGVLEY